MLDKLATKKTIELFRYFGYKDDNKTLTSLQNWLRVEKSITVWVVPYYIKKWKYSFHISKSGDLTWSIYDEKTWDTALENGLLSAIKKIETF